MKKRRTNIMNKLRKNVNKFYSTAVIHRDKIVGVVKILVALFGAFCSGIFTATIIECQEVDFILGGGLLLGALIAVCAAIGAYEDLGARE